MDYPRDFLYLLLLVCIFSTVSPLKKNPDGPSFLRRGRRVSLNEYLVPPPPPSHVRTGRFANPRPTEGPGYFSKLMNWLSPFGLGSSHSPQSLPPPPSYPENPLSPPQGLPLYPPLSPYSSPSLQNHNGAPLPNRNHFPAQPVINNHQQKYFPQSQQKTCNPCNKVPWIPMQSNSQQHPQQNNFYPPPAPQYPPLDSGVNNYHNLPNTHQISQDTYHAESQNIRTPDFSHVHLEPNRQAASIGPLPNPHLYPGPMPPLYKAQSFVRPHLPNRQTGYSEPPVLPSGSVQSNHQYQLPINHANNQDQASSGSQAHEGFANAGITAMPPNHGAKTHPVYTNREEPLESSALNKVVSTFDGSIQKEYRDGTVPNRVVGSSYSEPSNLSPPSFGSVLEDSLSQTYRDSYEQNSGQSSVSRQPDLDFLLGLESPNANNQDPGSGDNSNAKNSSNFSDGGIANKFSRIVVQASIERDPSSLEDPIYFEQSPLVDFTNNEESRKDSQWLSPTTEFIETGKTEEATKPTSIYDFGTEDPFFRDHFDFTGSTESHFSQDRARTDGDSLESSTPTNIKDYPDGSKPLDEDHEDAPYIPPSAQTGFLWPNLLVDAVKDKSALDNYENFIREGSVLEKANDASSKDERGVAQKHQYGKRNKQVQVIIPYTSEYTPIPFQQPLGDWSLRNQTERTQARKVSYSQEASENNYVGEESKRNEIRVVGQLGSGVNLSTYVNSSNSQRNFSRDGAARGNNSIDVRKLQKNIDNWTIQEYSRTTTSSTLLPSSSHPYLLPSKKIPEEYLTTTESIDSTSDADINESVKSYSLAGFSFNDVEREGSASNRAETTRQQVIRKESLGPISGIRNNTDTLREESSWKEFSVSTSPQNRERVYVVTPQPVPAKTSKTNVVNKKKEKDVESSTYPRKIVAIDEEKGKDELQEFEAIERAYQVLPQAVNNLAVASTGKENIPLWGIMEHEEFAVLNLSADDESEKEIVEGPVLYSGHSKVSRAR